MSIAVHFENVNAPSNGHGHFFSSLYHYADVSPDGILFFERFSPVRKDSAPSFMSFAPDCYRLMDINKQLENGGLNQTTTDFSKNLHQEAMNFHSKESTSRIGDFQDQECSDSKSKIWRPFSPPPSTQVDNATENAAQRRTTRTASRSAFYSIKPSNVKIGLSKTSVFKAVKKNAFVCSHCPSRYLSSRQLNSHMRVHTGSKPFRCEYPNCFKSFARNEELTRHKRIHSGYKPHLCTICKKRFGRKDHLSKHLKTHLQTSEKKVYLCSFPGCGHRYTRSDALTRHKSTAHAIKNQK